MEKNRTLRGTYGDIKVLALAAVENPNIEFFERQVVRAFSTTFHVSILEAETLSIERMLRDLYEYKYESMKLGDRVLEARELLKTSEEREEEERQELARLDEDETYLMKASKELVREKPKTTKTKAVEIPELPAELFIKFNKEKNPK